MRLFQVAAAIALIAIAVAILGVTVIDAKPSKQAVAVPASPAIDVMQMMIDAKDLPTQQFDAH
jgi:uncharacterized protein YoxC